ncbi:F-box/FBD/LRR-repeat protein At5g53840-like isoform X1 [Arachis ipaensis]|uniref:F-box/FBD/LRR-repeat protein At5g53840-like isoform X1 n=1 Tax=Arachis ipaensis TaxID=130454 RepID=UPI0007AFD711|nr:F-box/FBD/LRR-repeat protein At5g53840-like isoform X1 [Arachis ipaensis]XP_016177112.1 F-box/FBD/LRR-repeat protein At5g53840-like isoform X1 [Arachis ipaensis]
MDKISDLPKIILHDILSRLPYEDAARTSVLSKAWHETWSSFPILVFDGSRCVRLHKDRKDPLKIQENRRKANSFLKSVDRTLVRFHHHGFAIKEFNLSMMFFHPRFMPHLVDRWMKIVGESSSIQVLKLELELAGCFFGCKFDSHAVDNYYSLPPDVLKAKSLTELVLLGRIRADKLIVNHRIRFPMLRILSLFKVYLGHEQALEDLISGCPMIEHLILEHCVGLENVKVHDLPKLKSAKLSGFREIHVNVPSLECLHLGNDQLEFPCDISIDKCRNLKVFLLGAVSSVFISNQWLLELFDKFPFLERLELSGCVTSESLMISSSRLRVLSFEACVELKEAKIDAPNLESCRYSGQFSHMPAAISFVNCSNQVDFDVVFPIEFRMDLKRLRAFLQNIAPRNVMVSLYLGIMKGSSIVFHEDVLQNVEVPLPRIKQLRLSVDEETEELCVLLINDLFWSFRPAIISLNLKLCSRIFLKLLLEKLRCNNEEERCCSSSQMKCWWHDLKEVKVRSSPKKYENLSDCEELLDSLPINFFSPNLQLNFELEWDSLHTSSLSGGSINASPSIN